MPCCAGHAPVASVASVLLENVLARCSQLGNCALLDSSFLRPLGPNWGSNPSRASLRNCSKTTSTNNLGRVTAARSAPSGSAAPIHRTKSRRQMPIKKEFNKAGTSGIVLPYIQHPARPRVAFLAGFVGEDERTIYPTFIHHTSESRHLASADRRHHKDQYPLPASDRARGLPQASGRHLQHQLYQAVCACDRLRRGRNSGRVSPREIGRASCRER